jgi:peptidoglycan/LPS O-acetylase OafA/YrhL
MEQAMSHPVTSPRLHGLDAIRAFALLLGLVLHSAMSFLQGPYGIPLWIAQDIQAADAYAPVFYVPHIFRMVLFFLIAGFFARLAYERRGAIGFAIDRVKRIALPLVSFWMPVFAAIVVVAIWGAIKANGGEAPEPQEQPPLTAETFPLTHLWFLYLLCLFYPVAIVARLVWQLVERAIPVGKAVDAIVNLLTATPLGIVVLALPLTAAFMFQEGWMMWFGIPTPDTGLIPNTVALTGYGAAFAFGWILHRQADLMQRFRAWWPVYLVIAAGLTALCMNMIGMAPSFDTAAEDRSSWIYAFSYAAAGWAWSLGLIGLGLTLFARESAPVRYVADASYWSYIIHLPVVMALQVAFSDLALHGAVKLVLINAVTLALTLITYHFIVRGSWLGGWLNGRRYKRPGKSAATTAPVSANA